MSASKSRFSLGEMSTDEVEIPSAPLIARTSVPELVRPAEQGTEITPTPTPAPTPRSKSTVKIDSRIEQLAESEFTPAELRVKTSMSLPISLNDDLDSKVYDLKKKGFKKITREAVIEKALRMFLDKE